MKKRFLFLVPGLLLCLIAVFGGLAGYRVNLTPSMPLGVWKESSKLHRGSFVAACIPPGTKAAKLAGERGYLPSGLCPGGFVPLLKKIAAVPGDTVVLTGQAVWINSVCLPDSRTLSVDSNDRPLPHYPFGVYRVQPGQYWLFATDLP